MNSGPGSPASSGQGRSGLGTGFEAGAVDLFEVLDAQRAQLLAEDALADARTRSTVSVVALYRTMAGGWPGRMPLREKIAKE